MNLFEKFVAIIATVLAVAVLLGAVVGHLTRPRRRR